MFVSGRSLRFKFIGFLLTILGELEWRQGETLAQRTFLLKYSFLDKIIPDRWKPLYFMYLDETVNLGTNVSCLSGLYFSYKSQSAIRQSVYAVHRRIRDKLGIGPYADGVEIHGNELLQGVRFPNVDDEFRLGVLKDIVNIINTHRVEIFRMGYSNAREIAKFTKTKNQKLYGLHMLGFSQLMDYFTRTHKVIMVMDSTNQDVVETMSRMIYSQTSAALMFPEETLSYIIKKPYNILESVVYVDSKFSELMQLTDVIGYLFNKLDYKRQGKQLSEFAQKVVSIAEAIDQRLIYNSIIAMKIHNAPEKS